MHPTLSLRSALSLLATLAVACGEVSDMAGGEQVRETRSALSAPNGSDVNGSDVNGSDVNGSDVNGSDVNGSDVNGSDVNGSDVNGSDVNGSDVNGSDVNGSDVNGSDVNGSDVNGSDVNGSDVNGGALSGAATSGLRSTLEAVSLASIRLGEHPLQRAWLEGSVLTGIDRAGRTVRGGDLVGAEMVGTRGDGTGVLLRVEGFTLPEASDVAFYVVSYRTPSGWRPVCGAGADGEPRGAVAVAGRWDYREGVPSGGSKLQDPRAFTLGCVNSPIAKCALAGYKPWQGVVLEAHHQACIRMFRADYCGDGRSHTRDGVWINFYDGLGLQQDTEDWTVEAEWSEAGAVCVTPGRLRHLGRTPACGHGLAQSDCGQASHFQQGTLLMNEYRP